MYITSISRFRLYLFIILLLILFVHCGFQVYMLDMPVNDPIMFARDNHNSDLSKVEDGGYSGTFGLCPT
jgi:hypothetical protein